MSRAAAFKAAHEIGRNTNERDVPIFQLLVEKSDRQRVAVNVAFSTNRCPPGGARYCLLNMRPHRKITVDIDTEVTHVLYRVDWNANYQHCYRWQLMTTDVVHRRTSVLAGFQCSLLDFIHVTTASTHSEICDENTSTVNVAQ